MKNLLCLLIVLSAFSLKAEDAKSLLSKMKTLYASKSISCAMTYKLFKGHKSTEVHSSYGGVLYSNGDKLYQKINNTEFIYGKDFYLKISNEESVMELQAAQIGYRTPVDLDLALNECSESTVTQDDGFYTLILRFKSTSSVPCSVIKMRIRKKDFVLRRIDLYYTHLQDFSESFDQKDMHQPHLQIIYDNFEFDVNQKASLVELSTYFLQTKSAFSPKGIYKDYELIDYRLKH